METKEYYDLDHNLVSCLIGAAYVRATNKVDHMIVNVKITIMTDGVPRHATRRKRDPLNTRIYGGSPNKGIMTERVVKNDDASKIAFVLGEGDLNGYRSHDTQHADMWGDPVRTVFHATRTRLWGTGPERYICYDSGLGPGRIVGNLVQLNTADPDEVIHYMREGVMSMRERLGNDFTTW